MMNEYQMGPGPKREPYWGRGIQGAVETLLLDGKKPDDPNIIQIMKWYGQEKVLTIIVGFLLSQGKHANHPDFQSLMRIFGRDHIVTIALEIKNKLEAQKEKV